MRTLLFDELQLSCVLNEMRPYCSKLLHIGELPIITPAKAEVRLHPCRMGTYPGRLFQVFLCVCPLLHVDKTLMDLSGATSNRLHHYKGLPCLRN